MCLFHSSTASVLTIWHHWFTSDALGIITLAPLLIGLSATVRNRPPRSEIIEGAGALVTLTVMSGLIVFLPQQPWASVVAIATAISASTVACRPLPASLFRGSRVHRCADTCLDDHVRHWHFR